MAEEQACLVRARSDSENSSKLGSFGSIGRGMAYTEDRLTVTEGAGEPGSASNMAASPPDNPPDNESGELLDYNDSGVLEQFHEDALRQAGCGLAQARVLLATALAVAGAALELASAPFILPSAEIELCVRPQQKPGSGGVAASAALHPTVIELCVRPQQKTWLVLISLVGSSLGALGWAPLGERLGRRRALLSCLAVNAVFAAIAAVMPTYGTFMMARFCSSFGSGGIIPTSYTYLAEFCPRALRRVALPALPAAAALGALAAAGLARAALPPTGAAALHEDREHFSAWHRYLLLCTLPILASLASLMWTQESPRCLLAAAREVDAMLVYQSIHSSNQLGACGRGGGGGGAGALSLPGKRRPPAMDHPRHSVKMSIHSSNQLGACGRGGGGGGAGALSLPGKRRPPALEHPRHSVKMSWANQLGACGRGGGGGGAGALSLPGKRRPPALDHPRHSVKMIWQAFFQLFSHTYRSTTLSLGGTLLFTMTIQYYLSSYVPTTVERMDAALFGAARLTSRDETIEHMRYNETIENIRYVNVSFAHCSFRDLIMSHVQFANCSFADTSFENIKTSYAFFEGCQFYNSTIIDTDLEIGRELDEWCTFNGTIVRGMTGGCARRADLTSRLTGLVTSQSYCAHGTLLAAALALLPHKWLTVLMCAACVLLSPSLYVVQSETGLYIVEAVYRCFITLVFYIVSARVVDWYPANLRCTAHGLILSVALCGGALGRGAGPSGAPAAAAIVAGLGAAATAVALRLR